MEISCRPERSNAREADKRAYSIAIAQTGKEFFLFARILIK